MRLEWRLRALLARKNWPVTVFHARLVQCGYDLSYATARRYVVGERAVLRMLEQCCCALDCTPADLFAVIRDEPGGTPTHTRPPEPRFPRL